MKKYIILLLTILLFSHQTNAIAQTNAIGELNQKEYPWIGKLIIEKAGKPYECTSSYIGDQWVLTAAHCVDADNAIQIIFGGNLMNGGQIVDVDYILPHYLYNDRTLENDIALLHLRKDVAIYNTNLPPSNDTDLLKNKMYTMGYGVNENLKSNGKLNYNYAYLPGGTLPKGSLIKASYTNPVTKKISTTCFGDSGGPLVASGDQSILLGVSSSVVKGCNGSQPSNFTRVSYYLKWIATGKKSILKELDKRSDFEKIKTNKPSVSFYGTIPYIKFTKYGGAYFYSLVCNDDNGWSVGYSSWTEVIELPNYDRPVTLGCTGTYVNKDGKQTSASSQIVFTIPVYKPDYSLDLNDKRPTQPGQTASKPTTTNKPKPTDQGATVNWQVDPNVIHQNDKYGGGNYHYEKSDYYNFEYQNPFTKPSIILSVGDGSASYDLTYSGIGDVYFNVKKRTEISGYTCTGQVSNYKISTTNYQLLSIRKSCLSNIEIKLLSLRLTENNRYTDITFYKLS